MFDLWLDNLPLNTTREITEWQTVEFSCTPSAECTLALSVSGPLFATTLQPFLRPGEHTWRWQWNPHNDVGRFELTLSATFASGQVEQVVATLDVVPRKLNRQQYTALLKDMQRQAHALVTALAHSTAGAALRAPGEDNQQQPLLLEEYCRFYEEQIAALEQVVAAIARQPHRVLLPTVQQVPLGRAHHPTRVDPAEIARDPVHIGNRRSPLPSSVAQITSTSSTDTYENRFLKHLLTEYARRVRLVATAASDLASAPGSSTAERQAMHLIAARSGALVRRLQTLRGLPFLVAVRPLETLRGPGHLMQCDTPYRQIYQFWHDLRRSPVLDVESSLFQLPIHELPRLYECWSVLCVVEALLNLPDAVVQHQALFTRTVARTMAAERPSHLTSRLTLHEDEPLLMLDWEDLRLSLRYHPRYTPAHQHDKSEMAPCSLDDQTHIPDLALEYARPGQPPTVLIFDAKYRTDASGGLPGDALADAYTYLGSIGLPDGTRIVQRSLLLYPGQGQPRHYTSGISLLPLLPETLRLSADMLIALLTSSRTAIPGA